MFICILMCVTVSGLCIHCAVNLRLSVAGFSTAARCSYWLSEDDDVCAGSFDPCGWSRLLFRGEKAVSFLNMT